MSHSLAHLFATVDAMKSVRLIRNKNLNIFDGILHRHVFSARLSLKQTYDFFSKEWKVNTLIINTFKRFCTKSVPRKREPGGLKGIISPFPKILELFSGNGRQSWQMA